MSGGSTDEAGQRPGRPDGGPAARPDSASASVGERPAGSLRTQSPAGKAAAPADADADVLAARLARLTGLTEGGKAPVRGRPGSGGRGHGALRRRFLLIGRRTLLGLVGLTALLIAGFGVAYALTPVPSAQGAAAAQGSVFYYSDGKTSFAKQGTNRVLVPLGKVPEDVRNAVIAAENRSFYEDPGVSVRGTVRALFSTVSGRQLQGGSTITQQMVRNYYSGITQERTITRKVKEIMVSLKVSKQKDKDWILEQYLNTIYFGRDAYGIQAAARAYYGVDSDRLSTAQGVFLAAAIQQPTTFGSLTGETRPYAEQRWRSVIDAMVRAGTLDPAKAAKLTFPKAVKRRHTDTLKGQVGYMVNIAKRELLRRRGITEDQINRGGLKIITTFDRRLMEAAERAVKSSVPAGTSKKIRTGLVSVDPATGQVVAFYGGRDYLEENSSSVFGNWAQAGSGFKPIVLAAALESGEDLGTRVDGSSPQKFNGTRIRNSGNTDYGKVDLVTATQHSVNTAYVNLGQLIGLDKVTKMAEKLGIPPAQLTANQANTAPTFPLGTVSVYPVQQAGVYATFAAEGVHRTPYVVKAIKQPGEKQIDFKDRGERAFSKKIAHNATYAMSKVVTAGTGTGARLDDGRDVAGKTGTTDEGRAIWFNGFIPQLATSVAMYRVDNKPLTIPGYSVYGGVLPAQIWRAYTTEAVRDLPPVSFAPPSGDAWGEEAYDTVPAPTPVEPEPSIPSPPELEVPRPTPRPEPSGTVTPAPRPTTSTPTSGPVRPPQPPGRGAGRDVGGTRAPTAVRRIQPAGPAG